MNPRISLNESLKVGGIICFIVCWKKEKRQTRIYIFHTFIILHTLHIYFQHTVYTKYFTSNYDIIVISKLESCLSTFCV